MDELLYARAATIYAGSSQIQRNVIGERLFGLPKEPSAPLAYAGAGRTQSLTWTSATPQSTTHFAHR